MVFLRLSFSLPSCACLLPVGGAFEALNQNMYNCRSETTESVHGEFTKCFLTTIVYGLDVCDTKEVVKF